MVYNKQILMVAAENDALPNAKVGGIGDVLRDIPRALSQKGCLVNVVMPSHGHLHQLQGARRASHFPVEFRNDVTDVTLYKIPAASTRFSNSSDEGVVYWVLHHPDFAPGGQPSIYCDDGPMQPFATDASKYALFSAACAQAILNQAFGQLDILHLHDWHAAMIAVLRAYAPHYQALQSIRTVYSIHNLSLQGVRPLQGDPSSLQEWFPSLNYDRLQICDPRAPHCINPMRAGIRLSDKVHAVSPTYAEEIQQPSRSAEFFYGGEGLEEDLTTAAREGRLLGILNGCEYPQDNSNAKTERGQLARVMGEVLLQWVARSIHVSSAHFLASDRLKRWEAAQQQGLLVTSIGRITEQKVRLLHHKVNYSGAYCSVLEHLLKRLDGLGTMILLGSGDGDYERFLQTLAGTYTNFIFLHGYSDALSHAIYTGGDLFLMPSSFEPCGISQMLSMRAGQPCLVHRVGGLTDTVVDGKTGFAFSGENGDEQGVNFIRRFEEVLELRRKTPKKYAAIGRAAAQVRFTWEHSAEQYVSHLYE